MLLRRREGPGRVERSSGAARKVEIAEFRIGIRLAGQPPALLLIGPSRFTALPSRGPAGRQEPT